MKLKLKNSNIFRYFFEKNETSIKLFMEVFIFCIFVYSLV